MFGAQALPVPCSLTFSFKLSCFVLCAVTESMSAPEVWDAIPFLAKLQIIGTIGIFEHISEDKNFLAADGMTHYMRGGKPGYMPTFAANVHPSPLTLWDPFGFTKNLSAEEKAKKLNAEVNNGRLAMIGLFGFISASCVPGSVPALDGIIPAYRCPPPCPPTRTAPGLPPSLLFETPLHAHLSPLDAVPCLIFAAVTSWPPSSPPAAPSPCGPSATSGAKRVPPMGL